MHLNQNQTEYYQINDMITKKNQQHQELHRELTFRQSLDQID